jgi:putative transposase
MRHMGLWRRTRPRAPHTPHSRHGFRRFPHRVAGRVAREPGEIWGCDLTSVRLGAEVISLAMMMAVVTRDMRGGQRGRTLGPELPLSALQKALGHHTPGMPHSDQGRQDAAPQYSHVLQAAGSPIRMAAVGEPRQNGDAERVIRTMKEEESALAEYRAFAEALAPMGQLSDDG